MILRSLLRKVRLPVAVGLLGMTILLPGPAPAQEEVTDALRRYKDREVSTGFYEEYEVKPRRMKPFIKAPREAPPRATFSLQFHCRHCAEPDLPGRLSRRHPVL